MNELGSGIPAWESALIQSGFDLIQRFSVELYNAQVKEENKLPEFDNSYGVIIGNSKALWPHFTKFLGAHEGWLEAPNPFDRFVEKRIPECLETLDEKFNIRYSHLPEPNHIAFQRLAQISGLAFLSKSYLSIHPKFGPWVSLRAALVIQGVAELPLPEPMVNPCNQCKSSCEISFNKVLNKMEDQKSHQIIGWKEWLEVRNACPLGQRYKFGDEQIEYHYTKSKNQLLKFTNKIR